MNYGFAAIPHAEICEVPVKLQSERWCLQLYFHVAQPADLQEKDVLEVGSGRGGGAAFLAGLLKPASYTGMDYSPSAVELCRRKHLAPNLVFVEGDAEKMPFADASFDVVINVESSHCYPDFSRFVSEVHRVLRPGGLFAHTDFRDANQTDAWRSALSDAGFELVREANITPNVLAALERDDTRKRELIPRLVPGWLVGPSQDFAGTKGSIIERAFTSGEMRYLSFLLRKREG